MASAAKSVRRSFGPAPTYAAYKSPFGPKTKPVFNVYGWTTGGLIRFGWLASGFAVAAGVLAVYALDEVPRFQRDVVSKIPYIGDHFVREVAPEDNPF